MIEEIARTHEVTIVEVDDAYIAASNMGRDHFVNHSFCAGREIILGIYDDAELRLLSFFHELGHITDPGRQETTCKFDEEASAWKQALVLADSYDVRFSSKAFAWAISQLATYATPEYLPHDAVMKFASLFKDRP